MCGSTVPDSAEQLIEAGPPGGVARVVDLDLAEVARGIVHQDEVRRTAAGFVGYGATKPGDRVLIGVDSQTDPDLTGAIAQALREMGASVDVVIGQVEADREFTEVDEIGVAMRREPWVDRPRRWEGTPWIEELARTRGYDLLIHGKGGAIPKVDHRYEGFPWVVRDHFDRASNLFPRPLHRLINERTWGRIVDNAGGRLHLTDPEGTDLSLTILDGPFHDGGRHDYGTTPKWGHLMAHPPTPIEPDDDSSGVIAGTLTHFSRPFPAHRGQRRERPDDRGQRRGSTTARPGASWRRNWPPPSIPSSRARPVLAVGAGDRDEPEDRAAIEHPPAQLRWFRVGASPGGDHPLWPGYPLAIVRGGLGRRAPDSLRAPPCPPDGADDGDRNADGTGPGHRARSPVGVRRPRRSRSGGDVRGSRRAAVRRLDSRYPGRHRRRAPTRTTHGTRPPTSTGRRSGPPTEFTVFTINVKLDTVCRFPTTLEG